MIRTIGKILAVLLLGLATSSVAKPADAAFRHVADDFEAMAKREQVVGGALAFYRDGKPMFSRRFGMADEARNQPVDADTIFHWASVTKTFTAIALMQLVEDGRVRLDDPVTRYIPEFRAVHDPFGPIEDVTIRHLLTHSSGLREGTWPWNADGADKAPAWQPQSPAQMSQIYAMLPYTGLAFKPGSQYSYSNPGYSLMGRIVEIVSGDDIETYVDKNIFRPLGMTRSYFDVTPRHLAANRSASYLWRDGKRRDLGREFDTGATNGNGGINAPFGDMALYLNFLANIGDTALYERILPRARLQSMWMPIFATNYDPTVNEQMGQSFFVIDAKGDDGRQRRYIGHTGSQEGYRVFVYIHPETRTVAIMAVNTTISPGARPLVFATRLGLFRDVFPLFDKSRTAK